MRSHLRIKTQKSRVVKIHPFYYYGGEYMAKVILDISHHETVKDWSKLKENVSFLAFKATQGTTF